MNALMKTVKVTAELEAVIEKKEATRAEITKLIWAYIKSKDLQDKKDKRVINPDTKLAKVIGSDPINMMAMTGKISKHILK